MKTTEDAAHTAAETTTAMQEHSSHAPRNGRAVGRRALLALAATGAVGVGAVVAAPYAEREMSDLERQAILRAIGELEGVPLDAAIAAAELTRAAVQTIVLPVARLVAAIGGGALDALIHSLDTMLTVANALHLTILWLQEMREMFVEWRDGVTTLPIALSAFTSADINSAEAYLRALKRYVTTHPAGVA